MTSNKKSNYLKLNLKSNETNAENTHLIYNIF